MPRESALRFPGRIVKRGEADASLVRRIQRGLAARGYGPFAPGQYDAAMAAAVRLFQSQNVDLSGRPLGVDGEVGPFTWGSLFGPEAIAPAAPAPNAFLAGVLATAAAEIGVTEAPPGSNRGPRVDQYLARVGIPPSQGTAAERPWCAAFVYWCLDETARAQGVGNPAPRTAGVLDHWRKARRAGSATIVGKDEALASPARVVPGSLFVHDYGQGLGHIGFVESQSNGHLVTIEGNVAPVGAPGREGLCVARVARRRLTDDKLVGFVIHVA